MSEITSASSQAGVPSAEALAYRFQDYAHGIEVPVFKTGAEALQWYKNSLKEEREAWAKIIEADRAVVRQVAREETKLDRDMYIHTVFQRDLAWAQLREAEQTERLLEERIKAKDERYITAIKALEEMIEQAQELNDRMDNEHYTKRDAYHRELDAAKLVMREVYAPRKKIANVE